MYHIFALLPICIQKYHIAPQMTAKVRWATTSTTIHDNSDSATGNENDGECTKGNNVQNYQ